MVCLSRQNIRKVNIKRSVTFSKVLLSWDKGMDFHKTPKKILKKKEKSQNETCDTAQKNEVFH